MSKYQLHVMGKIYGTKGIKPGHLVYGNIHDTLIMLGSMMLKLQALSVPTAGKEVSPD